MGGNQNATGLRHTPIYCFTLFPFSVMLQLQGLVVTLISINVETNKDGIETYYWGEASGENRQRMLYRLGHKQMQSLIDQRDAHSYKALQGCMICFNGKEPGVDKGGFIVDKYIDENGAEVVLKTPRLIIGGLVNYVSKFSRHSYKMCIFSELAVETDKPLAKETPLNSAKSSKAIKAPVNGMELAA